MKPIILDEVTEEYHKVKTNEIERITERMFGYDNLTASRPEEELDIIIDELASLYSLVVLLAKSIEEAFGISGEIDKLLGKGETVQPVCGLFSVAGKPRRFNDLTVTVPLDPFTESRPAICRGKVT